MCAFIVCFRHSSAEIREQFSGNYGLQHSRSNSSTSGSPYTTVVSFLPTNNDSTLWQVFTHTTLYFCVCVQISTNRTSVVLRSAECFPHTASQYSPWKAFKHIILTSSLLSLTQGMSDWLSVCLLWKINTLCPNKSTTKQGNVFLL